jgi:hypothetical protein
MTNLDEDIKTYAVTPLNEECGLIEWVDNLRTLRDIIAKGLRERGAAPNVSLSLLDTLPGSFFWLTLLFSMILAK